MADLFDRQAELYSRIRPTYPPELFEFIASKAPSRGLAWDAGTGSGQAAISLSKLFDHVVATDVSRNQLDRAPALANVRFERTPDHPTSAELERIVGAGGSVDLVTVAQAIHWFDLPHVFENVKWALRRPNGVFAVWCYKNPTVGASVDAVFNPFYGVDSAPYWHPARKLVDGAYEDLFFPFDPVEGERTIGPFEFVAESEMDVEDYLGYLRSWSAYETAKQAGVELLSDEVITKFRVAWTEDGNDRKLVKFPIYLKMGRVPQP